MNFIDPEGLIRQPGKTPPSLWPELPSNLAGKGARWNSEGYYEGVGGGRFTWDNKYHGAGIDRGQGPQGGHWENEKMPGLRWQANGELVPGSKLKGRNCPPQKKNGPGGPRGLRGVAYLDYIQIILDVVDAQKRAEESGKDVWQQLIEDRYGVITLEDLGT